MRRFTLWIRLAFALSFFAASRPCLAQTQADAPTVTLTALSSSVYPAIALTARVQGDVEVAVNVRPDGSVESATVMSGPALLWKGALSSAEQSQFRCLNCGGEATSYHLIYTYRIVEPSIMPTTCFGTTPGGRTEVSHAGNHVTLIGHPSEYLDCVISRKVRSPKCLYLWKCGRKS